jgi:hypothetical protein
MRCAGSSGGWKKNFGDSMAKPVVTVAAGGLPVVDVTSIAPKAGTPVTEAVNGFGRAVTKVSQGGLPVIYVTQALVEPHATETDGGNHVEASRNQGRRRQEEGRAGRAQGR